MNKYQQKIHDGIPLNDRELARYYNYKYPTQPIIYLGRMMPNNPNRLPCDVRNFIVKRNHSIDAVIESLGIQKNDPNDEKVQKIQKWIVDNIHYVYDSNRVGYVEYWQTVDETLLLMTGDCEDGAILTASLMLAAGVPRWRLRIAAGLVRAGAAAETGGHAWCCYLRESDNKFVAIDWCYYPDMSPMVNKKTLKENSYYINTWFSWNDAYAWGNDSFDFDSIKCIEV